MFPIKTFGFTTSTRTINPTVFQRRTVSGVNPQVGLIQTTNWVTEFTGAIPSAIITVQSNDGSVYNATIINISQLSVSYVLFPVFVSYPKYRYYRFVFSKTIASNFETANTLMAIGRLKLYSHPNRQISPNLFTLSSNQTAVAPSDLQHLVNATSDVTLSWVATIPALALQLNIAFAVPTALFSYEFTSQAYPNNMNCLYSNQPSSWEIQGSNDNISFATLQNIDKFHSVATCSQSISLFTLPAPAPSSTGTVDIHIMATNTA